MEKTKQIGLFITRDTVYCAQTIDGKCHQIFSIILKDPTEKSAPGQKTKDGIDSIQAGNVLQEAFTTHNITAKTVNLSLPLNDIIFRTFTIPWVPSKDIASLVKFESSKYMPFDINQLSYTYHSIVVTEKGTKQIRIVFSAIKLQSIKKYKTFVESAGLKANLIEPEPFSLLRLLKGNAFIPEDDTIAVTLFDNNLGKVIIIDHGIPLFVREFSLAKENPSDSAYVEKFTNEIRISLDYFNRQNSHLKISKVFILSSFSRPDLSKAIESEIGLQALNLDFKSISEQKIEAASFLYSIGNSLTQEVDLPIQANLNSEVPTQKIKKQKNINENLNKKAVILTASMCLIFLITISTLGFVGYKKEEQKQKNVMGNLGAYYNQTIENIQTENTALTEQLKFYSQLKFTQTTSSLLALIAKEIPEGVWLEKLDIPYVSIARNTQESDITLDVPKNIQISGYSYHQDNQEQINLVNLFFNNIKSHELFSNNFKSIEIQSLRSETEGEFPITHFEILCQ